MTMQFCCNAFGRYWHSASIPRAAEFRTLLEVKRTSGEAVGYLGRSD
jgi:hypothetical protein